MSGQVIKMPNRKGGPPAPNSVAPWSVLGFATERDMLIDDLKVLDRRIKDRATAAHAIAALSKRKLEVLEQIKLLDAPVDDILDDSEDEAWSL